MSGSQREIVFFPSSAEKLLTTNLPSYAAERKLTFIRIASTVILFIVLLPYALSDILRRLRIRKLKKLREQKQLNGSQLSQSNNQSQKGSGGKKSKKAQKKSDEDVPVEQVEVNSEEHFKVELPWQIWSVFNIFALLGVIVLLLLTSNNKYAARAIFQAPFLTRVECKELIDMYNDAVKQKDILPLEQFPDASKEKVLRILDSRLGPLIERVYGIVPRALHANKISIHTNTNITPERSSGDHPYLLFQVELNDDYQGEVMFTNRADGYSMVMRSDVGSVLLFDASIKHEPLKSGDSNQYIMSGELSVYFHSQLDNQHTGISHCASFLSLPWLRVYLRNAAERKSGTLKVILLKLGSMLEVFTDLWARHFVANLVATEVGGKQDDFIVALDKSPIPWIVEAKQKAIWIKYAPSTKQTLAPDFISSEF